MRTRLELSNGVNLGLKDDVAYSLTFSIADIREPDKRNSNYSKTIQIPRSKDADKFFGFAFEIDGSGNYEVNKKTACTLYIDDEPQIIGFLQLLKINVTDNQLISYEVNIKGNVSNVFVEWGDKYITDIDISDLNHSYTKANQIASWTSDIGEGYVYPMIDYGYTNAHEFDVNNFFPALYLKEYIDRFFIFIGYRYESDFINTEFFKRLIVPNSSDKIFFNLTDEDKENRTVFVASGESNFTFPAYYATSIPFYIHYPAPDANILVLDTVDYDFYGQLNTSTSQITIEKTGQYNFQMSMAMTATASSPTNSIFNCYVHLRRIRDGVTTSVYVYETGTIYQGGSVVKGFETGAVAGKAGDIFYFGVSAVASFNDESCSLNILPVLNMLPLNIGVFDGNDILMNTTLPQKTKIKDFFKWIVQCFNLYITTDVQDDKLVYIEPRDDFYSNGITLDWTNKLSVDKPILIEPMGQLNAIRYDYKYKSDSDYWNKKYFDNHAENFGTETIIIENDFLKNTNTVEVGFSPTPNAQIDGTDRVIPQIVTVEATESGNNIKPQKKSNPRLLYYAGLKETTTSWKYTSFVSGDSDETEYAYAGHLDDVISPTLDLNFGVPFEVYYNAVAYTNNNLYNRFYKKFLEEITNKDSKIITCYLNLTPMDIANLDFRNQFYINGNLMRLNKVIDYNPISNQLTKCEFILIKDANIFVPTSVEVNKVLGQSPY